MTLQNNCFQNVYMYVCVHSHGIFCRESMLYTGTVSIQRYYFVVVFSFFEEKLNSNQSSSQRPFFLFVRKMFLFGLMIFVYTNKKD